MNSIESIFSEKSVRSIWRELRVSHVPLVSYEDIANAGEFADKIKRDISTNLYMPNIGHGYLGYSKSNGCTRFVPILTKEDLAVYYILILSIQDKILVDQVGVFGGWLSVPKSISKSKTDASELLIEPYFSNTFNQKAWFKNWQSFIKLLQATMNDGSVGNYVITSDIANFYDTIDLSKLIRDLRSKAHVEADIVDLLQTFLSFWDRRVKGYIPASKGIPQEIISDASRSLSHFYLQDVDGNMKNYCEENGLVYIRWADDFVITGSSKKKLEHAVHYLSKSVMKIGLNLSAAKTKIYTKKEYIQHRGLNVLEAVESGTVKQVERSLEVFLRESKSIPSRTDTVFRAIVNYQHKLGSKGSVHLASYIAREIENYEQAAQMSHAHIKKIVSMNSKPLEGVRAHLKTVLKHPYAAPRAELLRFLWRHKSWLLTSGATNSQLVSIARKVQNNSSDSSIISEICAPEAIARIES